jgi:putative endonuclease
VLTPPAKRFVYIIRSVAEPSRRCVGVTSGLASRLAAHNDGQNRSTAQWRPWMVDLCVEFRTEALAMRFEKYLKSGSGHESAKRHLVSD